MANSNFDENLNPESEIKNSILIGIPWELRPRIWAWLACRNNFEIKYVNYSNYNI